MTIASANFETRKILQIDKQTLRIKPTVGSIAFSLLFVVLGLALSVLWLASTFTAFNGPSSVFMLVLGLLFLAAGLGFYYSGNTQLLINSDIGVAFLKSWSPTVQLDTKSLSKHIQAQDITAIQTISRHVKSRSNKSKRSNSHTEYQVNLCTSDGERYNVFQTLKSPLADELGREMATLFHVPLLAH